MKDLSSHCSPFHALPCFLKTRGTFFRSIFLSLKAQVPLVEKAFIAKTKVMEIKNSVGFTPALLIIFRFF